MIKLGTNSIGKIYLGSNPIGKAYLGSNLVFQSGGSPTPPGPEPSVEPVFYNSLVFDGTAYIETDIIPDANASYKVSVGDETLYAAQRIFMVPATNSTNIGVLLGSSTTSTRRVFSVYYGASSAVLTGEGFNFATSARYNLWLTPNHFGWGDQSYSITKGTNTPSEGLILGSNTSHTGQPFTGTMGVFYIYGSDAQNATSSSDFSSFTPVYTLRPCTYNGEAGMWCVETSTFYGNTAGSGTLTVSGSSTPSYYFQGKRVAIIGDSISTYDQAGYKYDSYTMYYPKGDVNSVDKTWWKKLLVHDEATLEVNLSFSGSRVAPGTNFPSLCDRISLIGNADSVIIALGTNDTTVETPLGDYSYDKAISELSETNFREGIIKGIKMLQSANANIDIVFAIFSMDSSYRDSIKTIAEHYELKYADCGNNYPKYSGVHPSASGMTAIYNFFIYI